MIYTQTTDQTRTDLVLIESLALPLSFVVLVWVFGGLVAAALPMAIGIFQEGPGSVSPSVYWWREAAWWHEGQFTRIPAEIEGKNSGV